MNWYTVRVKTKHNGEYKIHFQARDKDHAKRRVKSSVFGYISHEILEEKPCRD